MPENNHHREPMAKVVILQSLSKLYRRPLFLKMHDNLSKHGIDLKVVYSKPPFREEMRHDNTPLPPDMSIESGYWLWGDRVLFQPCFREIWEADLVIFEPALKYILNPLFITLSALRIKLFASWVHGGNLRYPKSKLGFLLRKSYALLPGWRFAYTSGVASLLTQLGSDPATISVLQNAIDVTQFRNDLEKTGMDEVQDLRRSLNISSTDQVVLFCGSLYPTKEVGFSILACDQARNTIPGLHLIVIGAGPDEEIVIEAAKTRPWLHFQSAVHGAARAAYFKASDIAIMPYLTGLGIVDAMTAGLPYLVTNERRTNPEIDYLQDGVTGVITPNRLDLFAEAISSLLLDGERRQNMSRAARAASNEISIENMAMRFEQGIIDCLKAHKKLCPDCLSTS